MGGGTKTLDESDEELHLFEPGKLAIPGNIAEEIPDVGVYFLYWVTQRLRPDQVREIESAVNGRRCQNGWFPLESLDPIGSSRGAWRGPLAYLVRMTEKDPAIVKAWATIGLHGEVKDRIERTANRLLFEQGHAAAATWVMAVRPQSGLSLSMLGDALYRNWEDSVSSLRAKDVAKAVKRWNR